MFWKEIRGVFRSLRKNLAFTSLTVGILALGMGASIAVFAIVNAVLLKPLPFPDADHVFTLWDAPPPQMKLGFDEVPLHPKEFQFLASNARAFEAVAAFKSDQFNLNGATDSERIDGVRASADFFKALGIQPLSGRTFSARRRPSRSRARGGDWLWPLAAPFCQRSRVAGQDHPAEQRTLHSDWSDARRVHFSARRGDAEKFSVS